MKDMYLRNQKLQSFKQDLADKYKNDLLQRELKECTFKPKKISKFHLDNGETFEQRQEKWKLAKQHNIEQMKKQSKMEKLNECTFNPEILDPEQNLCYDEDFYERQVEWYQSVHENTKNYKEELHKKSHIHQPRTFISPFVNKRDVKESLVGEYIRSNSIIERENCDLHASNLNHSENSDEANFVPYNTSYQTPSGQFHNFLNHEVQDAQNIFDT